MTLDYRNPTIPQRLTRLDVLHSPDGAVEARFFSDPRYRTWVLVALPIQAISFAIVIYLLLAGHEQPFTWIVVALGFFGTWVAYRQQLIERSTHRLVASADELLIERVTPRGFIQRRQIPRSKLRQIHLSLRKSKASIRVSTKDWRPSPWILLSDFDQDEVISAVEAMRDALGLAPVDDRQ